VLLVEDNPTDLFVIQEVLERCGVALRVQVARNGQEALRYVRSLGHGEKGGRPALILLDLNLPKVAGIDVLRQLRSGLGDERIPVIIVSSSAAASDKAAARALGAEAYFQKPSDLKAYMKLGEIVKKFLR
jgi:CheY-like chemotaxis protein